MSFNATDISLYRRKDGGLGIHTSDKELTLLYKGQVVYAQKKAFAYNGTPKLKCSISVQGELKQQLSLFEEELIGSICQFEENEENSQHPSLFEQGTWYSPMREFNSKTWLTLKIPEDIKVFEKVKGKLKPSTLEDWPEESVIFPTFKINSVWVMEVKGEKKVGITFEMVQVFFEKLKGPSKDTTDLSMADYI